MDIGGMIWSAILHWWWLYLLAALGLFLRTPVGKGMIGELFVALVARFRLNRNTYHRLHNVTVPSRGGTTQIDHVIVSRFGIFVIETKNMKGWIFGRQHDATWTQQIFKHRQKFLNPLRQNYKHTQALMELLGVPQDTVHSVIAFVGQAELKTELPSNVTVGPGFVNHVLSFTNPVFSDAEVASLLGCLKAGRLPPTLKTQRAHVQGLQNRPKDER